MRKHYTAVCSSKKMSKRPLRRVIASVDDWAKLIVQLESEYYDQGIDPLYKITDAGQSLTDICVAVEDDEGVWLEPSVQGGQGMIVIYDKDDNRLASGIDYPSYNSNVVETAIDSATEQEFRVGYQSYLESLLDDYAVGDAEDEDNYDEDDEDEDEDEDED